MRSLWSVLIIDTKLQLQSTFESIIQELLREITNKSERIREACCLGIADIIKSKSLESLSLYVEDLYRNLFYVLDDISDTVRLASLQFAKSLLQVSEKMCDISSMKKEDATRAVNLILPSLLNKGLSHSAKEVRALSMEGIIRITKVAGDTLRPHLPNLIEEILVAMSSTEPMELSYAMFHSQALNVTVEQIESTRLMLANSSPLSTALDQCVNLVDDSCLDDVVQKLVEIIRVGVGFASVTSSAKVIKILVSRFPSLMKDHASKVIFALKLGLFDQSATIRKVYSECMSSICSIASENQVHSVLKMISELYLSSNSPENRRISGVLALEISKVSGDSIVSQFSKIIPLAYIASKDVDNESANLWLQMFNECSSGEASTIDKYLSDILALQLDMIASPIYDIRDTGLISLGHLSKLCKSNQEFRLQTPSILQTLLKCLEYQDWAGKHNLFETISEVIKCVPQISTSEESSIPILIKHLISDDSKEFSIKSLGKLTVSLKVILDTFPNSRVDAFLDIKNFLVSLLRVFSEKGDETNDLNRESRELMISVYECMGSLLPVKENAKYQQEFIGSILRLLMGGVLGQHYLIRASALRSIAS